MATPPLASTKKPSIAILPVMIGATLALIGLSYWMEGRERAAAGSSDQPMLTRMLNGVEAPAFAAKTLSGEAVNFPADYRGRLVLLQFWATWCPPCRAEVPHLREAYEEFHDRGFDILGVSLDGPRGRSATAVRQFLTGARMQWDVIHEDVERIAGAYNVTSIPALFLVDGNTGEIIATEEMLRGDALKRTIDAGLHQMGK